jgi:cell division protein FtsL
METLLTTNAVTPLGMLLIAVWAGARGTWLWGTQHQAIVDDLKGQLLECKKDRDEWKELALQATTLAKTTASVAEQTVKKV